MGKVDKADIRGEQCNVEGPSWHECDTRHEIPR